MSDERGQPGRRAPRPRHCEVPLVRDGRRRPGRFFGVVERVTRGPVAVVVTVALFVAAGVLGGRGGIAVASVWVAVLATYCLANFSRCREAHCIVTGTGWAATSFLGFAAAIIPGPALSWYVPGVQAAIFLAILGLGYGFEGTVRMRTGDRFLR